MPPAFYCIPRDRLAGRSAEMAFADVVYCLAAIKGWDYVPIPGARALELDFTRVCALSGLEVSTVTDELNKAERQKWLQRTTIGSRTTEEIYLLNYGALAEGHGAPRKPVAYVENGWLHTLYTLNRSYLPQRVLNLVWFMRFGPEPREISLDELCVRAAPKNTRPLNAARILDPLDLLERLGILLPQGEGEHQYQLNKDCFNQPAPSPETVQGRWDGRRIRQTEVYRQLAAQDERRAQQALEVLLAGRFDPECDLAAIHSDLRWIADEADFKQLLELARRRPKHNLHPAWPDLWRNHRRRRLESLTSQTHERSGEVTVHFDERAEHAALLGLIGPTVEAVGQVWLHARLRGTVAARQAAQQSGALPEARLHLQWSASTELLTVSLKLGQSHPWLLSLAALGEHAPLHFTLQAYTRQPVPGLWLEAWLEAEMKR